MSDVLRSRRKARGLTQEQLGNLVGVDKRTISDLECGANRNPSWQVVGRLAETLKVEPADLFPISQPATQ